MNRTAAESFAQQIRQLYPPFSALGIKERDSLVADIIERACGQDNNKALWLLEEVARWFGKQCGWDEARRMEAKLEEAMRMIRGERSCGETAWVSVSERLPEKAGEYLVYTSLGAYLVSDFEDGIFDGDLRGFTDNPERVTEWAALPSPPTGRMEEK